MTERLYYTDPARRRFDAIVTGALTHEERPAVTLDRTAFYPTSGGQPFDTGRIGDARVIDTFELDDDIVHVLSAPLAAGLRVEAEIDWARRTDHMQQHTGQHVLSAAVDRLFGNRTMSFHMGAETATIDLEREMSSTEVERAVDEANRVVWEDRPVSIRFASAVEAAALPLRKESVRDGTLRLIEVEGFDLSACGGTHVARTGAIGIIALIGSERFRGGIRLTFVCGNRALTLLRGYRDAIAGAVRALSVLPSELPAAVEKLQGEAKDLRKTIKGMQESLATHEAARLLTASAEAGGVRVAVHIVEGWDAGGLKTIASAMTNHGLAAVALVAATSPVQIVVARSSAVPIDAGAVLKQLVAQFGGRGGGRPELAQGGGFTADARVVAEAARALLEQLLRT
jgi:alanyl-tRNA synthetase